MPVSVIDNATGQPIDVPEADLANAYKSGKVGLIGGTKFNVRSPSGKLGTVDAQDLHVAIGNGAQVLSDAEMEQRQADRDYGGVGGALIAGAGGAAEQASLGLAPALLPDSAKKGLALAEAAHPWMHGAGEVAGMAGLAAATGGLGLEGGLAGLAGRGAEAALGEGASSVLGRVASRAIVGATKGVVEGAQYGEASNIAHTTLDPDQHPLTAASILADVGANALWGGALGGGLGALGGGVQELLGKRAPAAAEVPDNPLTTALGDTRTPSTRDVEKVAGKAMGVQPQEGLGAAIKGWYPKVAGAISGASPDDIAAFSGGILDRDSPAYQNRAALLTADTDRAAASLKIKDHLDTLLDADKTLTSATQDAPTVKASSLGKLTADVDPVASAQAARATADDVLSKLQGMADKPDTFGTGKPLANAMTFASKMSDRLDDAIQANDVSAQYAALDSLKSGIKKYAVGAANLPTDAAVDELVAMQSKARATTLQGIYDGVRTGLEDEKVWGDAGAAQRGMNDALERQAVAADQFHQALTTEVAPDVEQPWIKTRVVDPAKVQGYVNGLVDPGKDLTHQAVLNYVWASRDLADSMGDLWDLPPKQAEAATALKNAAQDFQDTLGQASRQVAVTNQFEKFRGKTTGHGLGLLASMAAFGGEHLGGVAGGVAGYGVGKVVGNIAKTFTQPAETAMKIARIEGMVRRSDSRIARGVAGFLRGASGAASSVDASAFARRSAQVRDFAADPQATQARIQRNASAVSSMHAALGQHLVATTQAGIGYLQAKLPRELPRDPMDPSAKVPLPPPSQRESFMRSYRAVTDPLSVMDDLKAGRLSMEGIDALKTVYPPLYAKVQMAVSDALSKQKEPLPYQKQVALSMLLGLPSPYSSPDYLAQRQAAYQTPGNPSPPAGPQKKNARKKPMNLTSQLSPSQRVEAGQHDESS